MEFITAKEILKIESPSFQDGGEIPARHTCDGEGTIPPLRIDGVPLSAESLALIMEDPDSPSGTFTHWVRFNLPATFAGNREGEDIEGGMGLNSAGGLDCYPPCPREGEHRYYFKLYALSAKLDLPDGVSVVDLEQAMDGKILAKAALVGRYRRSAQN